MYPLSSFPVYSLLPLSEASLEEAEPTHLCLGSNSCSSPSHFQVVRAQLLLSFPTAPSLWSSYIKSW